MLDFKLTINITVELIFAALGRREEVDLGMGGWAGPGSLVPSITSSLSKSGKGTRCRSPVPEKPLKALQQL